MLCWLAAEDRGMADQRIVYGAFCSWWDSISAASRTPSGIPCCPHCGGVLFEVPTEESWWADVDRYEAAGHSGYRAFIEWERGRCFPSPGIALSIYRWTRDG